MVRALLFLTLLVALAGGLAGRSPQGQVAKDSTQTRSDSDEVYQQYESALALFKQEKYEEALTVAKRVVEMREKSDGRDSPLTAQALMLLASINRLSGHGEKAEPLYKRAIAIWEKRSDAAQSDYVNALEGYSCLLRRASHDEDAEKYGRRARELIVHLAASPKSAQNSLTLTMNPTVFDRSAIDKPELQVASNETNVGGSVAVETTVDESGNVILACAQSGPVRLWEASERTAYRWRFKPTLLSGVPVKVRGTITFTFKPL
jgi:tetratricopeptide (TPR) repeat protein